MSQYGVMPEGNLEVLAANPYPGRLLVAGFAGETIVQAYAVEGRSEPSQNRILVEQDNIVSTEVFDKTQSVGDRALTIYDAMRSIGGVHVVSNGDQTNTVAQYLRSGGSFAEAMDARDHEPDAPNFTPRISAYILGYDRAHFGISVISRDPAAEDPKELVSQRRLYTADSLEIDLTQAENVGYAVHTYARDPGDGQPLVSFDEAPFLVPVEPVAQDMAEVLWENLDPKNRVSVAAKTINPDGTIDIHIINRHQQ